MEKRYWVYLVTDKPYGTIYVGVTNSLARRSHEHRNGQYIGFTKRYGLSKLVYYEEYGQIDEAIEREKKIKKWRRNWKIDLVRGFNPEWKDLCEEIYK